MKVLVLANNEVSKPLIGWLDEREDVTIRQTKMTRDEMRSLGPELVVSYCYRHILKPDVIAEMPGKLINLHISYLPYNRGADPNAWSFLDDTPKGVTVHLIDAGVDTGPTLLQKRVAFDEAHDTLLGTYFKLHQELRELFIENWGAIRVGAIQPKPQMATGTYHRSAEFAAIRERLLGVEGWDITIKLFRDRYRQLSGSDMYGHGQ